MKVVKFIKAYIKSMRPYLFLVTGIAGWLGIAFSNLQAGILRQIIVLVILFTSWGINQIINDFLGLKEDRINAPHRPMVTGELNIKYALITTFLFFLLGGIITYLLNPYALILYFIGYVFNIIYEYFKGIPLLGNIWFGVLMGICPLYGALAISQENFMIIFSNKDLLFVSLFVVLICSTMCFFTYFKDYRGDKLTGKKTLVVLLSPVRAKFLNFIMSTFPFIILFVILYYKIWQPGINLYFLIFIGISFIILQYTAFLYFKNPQGEKSYYSLKWNFTGTVLFKSSFVALVNPLLSMMIFIGGFILVGYLFSICKDPLA